MKKYRVLNAIGSVISTLGGITFFFGLCIDLDHSPDSAIWIMVAMMLGGVGVVLFGQLLCNWAEVEGFLAGLLVVVGAWMYKRLRKPRKFCRQCYKMKKQSGSYVDTIQCFRARYEEYIDSMYEEELLDSYNEYHAEGSVEYYE